MAGAARTGVVAAPKFAPVPAIGDVKSYRSPAYVPDGWDGRPPGRPRRPPAGGPGLGFQGPDQGYALRPGRPAAPAARAVRRRAGRRCRHRLHGDRDAPGVAVRAGAGDPRPAHRVHDLGVPRRRPGRRSGRRCGSPVRGRRRSPSLRGACGLSSTRVPEATLRMTPAEVNEIYSVSWKRPARRDAEGRCSPVDGVGAEVVEADELERRDVRRLEHDRARRAAGERLGPARRAHAPLIAGHEAGEAELRRRRRQIVAVRRLEARGTRRSRGSTRRACPGRRRGSRSTRCGRSR